MRLSIVVSSWNEGRHFGGTLKRLRSTMGGEGVEIVVVDGGSKDATIKTAREYADKVIPLGGANRGVQFHRGAKASDGELLLFLHADAQLPGDWRQALETFWTGESSRNASASVFSVHYGSGLGNGVAAVGSNWRASLRQIAYGEAGFCVPKRVYEESGGFPDYPMMEDLAFCRRLKKLGKIVRLKERIRPAARHLRRVGPLRSMLRSFVARIRFAMGESPESLFRRYAESERRSPNRPEPWDGEALLKRAVRDRGLS
jgi:glycosyltransferase involved in cell wall biosynthesis